MAIVTQYGGGDFLPLLHTSLVTMMSVDAHLGACRESPHPLIDGGVVGTGQDCRAYTKMADAYQLLSDTDLHSCL